MRIIFLMTGLLGMLLVMPALVHTSRQDSAKPSIWTSHATPARPVADDNQDQAEQGNDQAASASEDTKGALTGGKEEEPAVVNPSGISKREHKKIQIDLSDLVIRPV